MKLFHAQGARRVVVASGSRVGGRVRRSVGGDVAGSRPALEASRRSARPCAVAPPLSATSERESEWEVVENLPPLSASTPLSGAGENQDEKPMLAQVKRGKSGKAESILKEAEDRLLAALDKSGADDIAEAISSATKRIRRVPKYVIRDFYPASEGFQGAWSACLYSVDEMNVHSLDKLLHSLAYAKNNKCSPPQVLEILERVEDTLAAGDTLLNTSPSVVTNLLGSFSRLDHSMSMELQDKFGQYLSLKVGQYDVRDLARALSHLNKVPRFNGLKKYTLALCSGHIARNVADLTANQISECMVAFAFSSFQPALKDLKCLEDQFTESFFVHEEGSAASYDIRALMRLLKSYAKLRIQLPAFIVEGLTALFAEEEGAQGSLLKPKDASNLIWYFAKMNQYPGSGLLDAACRCLVRFFDASNSAGGAKQGGANYVHVQHMSKISWGLAKLRHRPPPGMMPSVSLFASRHVKYLQDSEIVQIVYGHALLDEAMPPEALKVFCQALLARCRAGREGGPTGGDREGVSLRNLSLLLWSLTVLRVWEDGLAGELDKFWAILGSQEKDLDYLNVRGKHALHVAATCGLSEAGGLLAKIPEQFTSGSFAGMEAIAREDKPASEIQREISLVLDAMDVPYFDHTSSSSSSSSGSDEDGGASGYSADTGLLSADFYIGGTEGETGNVGGKVCMEVDGPSHFFLNTLEPTGKTLFRNRVHACKGWRVVCLPHFEWEQLLDDQQKEAYLRDILANNE